MRSLSIALVILALLSGCGETVSAVLPPQSITVATPVGTATVATPGGPVSVTIPGKAGSAPVGTATVVVSTPVAVTGGVVTPVGAAVVNAK